MTDLSPFTVADLRRTVAGLVGKQPQDIADDANFVQLGVDSVGMLRLVNRVRRTGVRPPTAELTADPTIQNWQRCLHLPADDHA